MKLNQNLSNKFIFHVDFDSYFVSVERKLNPKLKNKPVGIAANSIKGAVTSVSYELKNKGIKITDKVYQVRQIVPDVVIVEPHFKEYRNLSSQIFNFVAQNYCKKIEVASIDEFYLDVSEIVSDPQGAIQLAKKIQQHILKKFDIPCTIGISHTKFLAKMTTNCFKPFGLEYTSFDQILTKFGNLDLNKVHGIGNKTAEKLNEHGYYKYSDLYQKNISFEKINNILGAHGNKLLDDINGYGSAVVDNSLHEFKSIGHEVTMDPEFFYSWEGTTEILKYLCDKVSLRLKNRNLAGDVVVVLVRSFEKKWQIKQHKIDHFIYEANDIYKHALPILSELYFDDNFLGVGVRVTNLQNINIINKQLNLFDNFQKDRNKISDILASVAQQVGIGNVTRLSELKSKNKQKNVQNFFLEDDFFE
ncbi:DNA polymerase IV [Mycoplasmopsis pullorum]|uniref:Y-family DNA polymerase n=1 Tax=Mycoplasmopsis pullorum TaxID=48003 RepID=UPI0011196F3F|nr:DNA polymerase IV [Mycoplasmopsis pullorum]TNK83971.1 DNA polymerase IV [Mycoplasmopsis pullorum]TNK92547.1 DNA polymerase IV [Mycoplasmopsis pullorum]